jgi:hypothetical protein
LAKEILQAEEPTSACSLRRRQPGGLLRQSPTQRLLEAVGGLPSFVMASLLVGVAHQGSSPGDAQDLQKEATRWTRTRRRLPTFERREQRKSGVTVTVIIVDHDSMMMVLTIMKRGRFELCILPKVKTKHFLELI